jgi:Zn-finger nucleic acid-binding protein
MMNCPKCEASQLLERERDAVIVDICPSCRGVWLDKGELEKLISKSVAELNDFGASPPTQETRTARPVANQHESYSRAPDSDRNPQYGRRAPDSDRHPQYGHPQYGQQGQHKRKRSFLESFGDLFD